MRYLLDTCVISDFVKGEPGTVDRLLAATPDDIAVPVLAYFEVEYGLLLDKKRARTLRPKLQAFFEAVHTLDFDCSDAEEAAAVRAELRKAGLPIGPYDVLIAGTARRHGLTMVTANDREFRRVPRLSVECWRA